MCARQTFGKMRSRRILPYATSKSPPPALLTQRRWLLLRVAVCSFACVWAPPLRRHGPPAFSAIRPSGLAGAWRGLGRLAPLPPPPLPQAPPPLLHLLPHLCARLLLAGPSLEPRPRLELLPLRLPSGSGPCLRRGRLPWLVLEQPGVDTSELFILTLRFIRPASLFTFYSLLLFFRTPLHALHFLGSPRRPACARASSSAARVRGLVHAHARV